MRSKFLLLILFITASTLYGIYSIYRMLYQNKTPYTVECSGVQLDSNKVIAISNYEQRSKDTLFVNFAQSKVIMPFTLGYLFFDKFKNEFVLKNNACVFNPSGDKPANYFLPFCRTLNGGKFSAVKYFGASEIISQDILLKKGVKYNSGVGTPENRISIELVKFKNQLFLTTKDDGIETKYPVKSNAENVYDIILNQPVTSNSPAIFLFDNTTFKSAKYSLEIKANTFEVSYIVKDNNGSIIQKEKSSNPTFIVDGYLFSITPKYTQFFSILYLLFFACIVGFQIYFLKLYTNTGSPVIQSLFSIRILLNCIVFLATPLFLTSYYLAQGRSYYLLLVLLLNLSFFISKRVLHNIDVSRHKGFITKIIWGIVLLAPIAIKVFTQNESLFGLIPVLHVQKIIILLMIFVTQDNFLKSYKYSYWFRIFFIVAYTFLISAITSDMGSFIYTALAFLLVELVRKTIKLRSAILWTVCLAGVVFIAYSLFPEKLSERKYYRLVAPYTTPESVNLTMANQADRESYSTLLLNLKNILEFKTPHFNNIVIPANMRSTSHSDFAFYWSFTFGGLIFFILFTSIVLFLISNFILLLFCSIRECRIGDHKSFAFPLTREAELVRFLLAFTIISFVYPLASNTLLIPLTGQSIPCLSISNIEIIFLTLLLVSLGSIFSYEKYINTNSKVKYYYADAKMSMKYALFSVTAVFALAFAARAVSLYFIDNSLVWKKHISDESIKLNQQIPGYADKEGLVQFAKTVIGNDDLINIDKTKKPILKTLASLYYSNKPYAQTIYESAVFVNSTTKLLNQITVDSILNTKSKLISGIQHPFGAVYAFNQRVNNKQVIKVTNPYYNCIPFDAESINADLTAECNRELKSHLSLIGMPGNIGSVMIVENNTGSIISNSSFPLVSGINSSQVYYFIGSLKKSLIAYAALKIDTSYRSKVYGGKSFQEFLQYSDDYYSAVLLKDLLQNNKAKLNEVLTGDFDLPLYSLTDDAFLDSMPGENDFKKELNRNSTIYRQSIGQQKPYKFSEVMQWYARMASGLKIELSYLKEKKPYSPQSLNREERKYLLASLNKVLYGTATVVRTALENNTIKTDKMICKTGTAENSDRNDNSASSFIIANAHYTIGIMLKGNIPDNSEKLAAKDLFIKIIPLLKKYKILD